MNMQKHIKHAIWDLDDTLYKISTPLSENFALAACDGIREIIDPELSNKEIISTINKSREMHGNSFAEFVRQGHSEKELHRAHHAHLNHKHIIPDEDLKQALKELKAAGVISVVLTHGTEDWGERATRQAEIRDYIDAIYSTEHHDYMKKNHGPELLIRTMEIIKAKPEETAFIDDRHDNLLHAHPIGVHTINVHQNRIDVSTPKPDYIDVRCATALDAVTHLLSLQKPTMPKPEKPSRG
jgi:FMN phosphatase YigB (HAD superfamily)